MTTISTATAEHYEWGGGCDGWHLLRNPALSVIQERVPAGLGEIRHFHSHARQFFYVLRGEATLEMENGTVTLGAGEGIEVAPRVPHRFANKSLREVEFLVISSPTTAGDRTNIGET